MKLGLLGVLSVCCGVFFSAPALAQTITELSGVLEYRAEPSAMWRPADGTEQMLVGSSLRSFQGQASLNLDEAIVKLHTHSELEQAPNGFRLVQGSIYIQSKKTFTLRMPDPIKIVGEARLDSTAEGLRFAVLSGIGQVITGANVFKLNTGEQLVITNQAKTVSNFQEQDPWYRSFTLTGEGLGRVIGFQGEAELFYNDSWQPATLRASFSPTMLARTGEASWLEIRFDDGNIIRLQALTELALLKLEDLEEGFRRSVLELRYGKVWAIVVNQGEPFQIETPGLIAGVRGTKFRLDASQDTSPALIKTFEGVVAGIVGFSETTVAEGQQFDLKSGVQALVIDSLDAFNLERDSLIIPPDLSLDPLPTSISATYVTITGLASPGSLVSLKGQSSSQTENGSFSLEARLQNGFNLIEVSARAKAMGAVSSQHIPIISTAKAVFLDANVQSDQSSLLLWGVAPAGSHLEITGEFGKRETFSNAQGYFRLRLPLSKALHLRASLSSGEFAEKEFKLQP